MNQGERGQPPAEATDGEFWFRGKHGTGVLEYADLRETSTELADGVWAVVAEFDGPWHAWRVADVHDCDGNFTCVIPVTDAAPGRPSPSARGGHWRSSLERAEYEAGVERIHHEIDAGLIEQVNLCRVLQAPLDSPPPARWLHRFVREQHEAPYSGHFEFTDADGRPVWVVSASPELAGSLEAGTLTVSPIKGTAVSAESLLAKDYAENELVTMAVATDLRSRLGVEPHIDLFQIEEHPSLVQLVSTITLNLSRRTDPVGWAGVVHALVPPLSVVGVPVAPARRVIRELERVPRGPYCGALGWLDTQTGSAELGATIRSFWWRDGYLRFGTGAGITRDSDPRQEWEETELKAARLLKLVNAAGVWGS